MDKRDTDDLASATASGDTPSFGGIFNNPHLLYSPKEVPGGHHPEQTAPRLLLARAYYRSAQLHRAEAELRIIVDRDPVEHYARLMLGRTLERRSRPEEAAPHLRIAAALAGDFPRE